MEGPVRGLLTESAAMALNVVEISGGRFSKRASRSQPTESGGSVPVPGTASESPIADSSQAPRFEKLQSIQVVQLFTQSFTKPPLKYGRTLSTSSLQLQHDLNLAEQVPEADAFQENPPCHYPGSSTALSLRLVESPGKLSTLRRLVVTHYAITCIPSEISCLTSLEELNLSFNRIASIPPEIGSLSRLKLLSLSSNKIVSPLPRELKCLASLEILILGHNQLAEVSPVDLSNLPSLTYLDLQFNCLRKEVEVPAWVTCNLDGNELLAHDSFGLDLLERSTEEDVSPKGAVRVEAELDTDNEMTDPQKLLKLDAFPLEETRRSSPVRKRDRSETESVQAETANEQKLKKSDGAGMQLVCDVGAEGAEWVDGLERVAEQEFDTPIDDVVREDASNDQELRMSDAAERLELPEESASSKSCDRADSVGDGVTVEEAEVISPVESASGQGAPLDDETLPLGSEPKPVSWKPKGSRGRTRVARATRADEQIDGPENHPELAEQTSSSSDSESEGESESSEGDLTLGRKHGRGRDRNPKPSKRRRAILESSPVSEKYHRDSLCGAEDRLHDGFYDPGRERPFLSLEEFEREAPSVHTREVILVDRAQDEELDVIASSARSLLQNLQTSTPITEHSARALALFVSDCFGGSDRSDDTLIFRRTTLGIAPTNSPTSSHTPMTSSRTTLTSSRTTLTPFRPSLAAQAAAALPSVRALCEEAVRFVKLRRGSNVVPIGALPVGICRHRAILFKYLCDRARPSIPCELVRGYLDCEPHAWNVVLLKGDGRERRLLVDCCQPGRIQDEGEGGAWFRYLPLKRIDVEELRGDTEELVKRLGEQSGERLGERLDEGLDERLDERLDDRLEEGLVDRLSDSERGLHGGLADEIVLHEEIGRGASGAIVRRCTIGGVRLAAKVISSEALSGGLVAGATGQIPQPSVPQGLSELRMLYSLGAHPCIVRCFGHQIRTSGGTNRSLELLLFLEHVQSGSLEALLRRRSDQGLEAPLPPLLALQIAEKLAQGLAAVHAHGVVHRDVKSGNVLVEAVPGEEPRVKLCDFSSAVLEGTSSVGGGVTLALGGTPPADVCVGTPRWMAPDVLRAMYGRHPYGREADIWSFGCVILEMLTLAPPYSGLSEAQVHSYIQIGRRPELPADLQQLRPKASHVALDDLLESLSGEDDEAFCTRMLVGLFCACTNGDAALRPSASSVAAFLGKLGTLLTKGTAVPKGMTEEGGTHSEGADGIEKNQAGAIATPLDDSLKTTQRVVAKHNRSKDD